MGNNKTGNYKALSLKDLNSDILKTFNRYQETKQVLYKANDKYGVKEDYFTEKWDKQKKSNVIQSLKECILSGGIVIGAFSDNNLVGFANVEGEFFGTNNQYLELPYIHVSKEFRGKGIGKKIFELCCIKAKEKGAEKLYIAAHPSVETQHFYKSVGCTFAEEINEEIYNKEPLDIQLEVKL